MSDPAPRLSARTCAFAVAIIVSLLLLTGPPLLAQVDAGAVLGTVRDASGAVIPGATVTLRDQQTALALTTRTDSSGNYTFNPVKIGLYSAEASFHGFQQVVRTNISVHVQQQVVVVNFTLPTGQATQTVQVTATPAQLQTANASVGQVIGARQINSLPLNGRNYTFLAQLSAGVTQGQEDTRGLGATGSFSANGQRPAQNNYLLDGIDDNADLVDFLNGTAYVVSPDRSECHGSPPSSTV